MAKGDKISVQTDDGKIVTGPEHERTVNLFDVGLVNAKPKDSIATSEGPVTGIRSETPKSKK